MGDLSERRVVLFDFDGTLADTKRAIVDTATAVLLDFGITPDELGDVSRLIGPPFPEAFCEVYGLAPGDAQRVTDHYRDIYAALGRAAWPLFPGTSELVSALRSADKTVCVATSKKQDVIEQALADNGLADSFDAVVGKRTDKPFSKAQTITLTLDLIHAAPDEAVMVGDRRYDVEGAKACGLPCVGVTYGGTGDYAELSGAGADRVVDTVAQLAEVLLGGTHGGAAHGVQL